MSRNQVLLGIIAAALVALGIGAWYTMGGGQSVLGGVTGHAYGGSTADDRTLGDPRAPVVVIEYAAPQCPYCARFNAEGVPALRAQYIDAGKVFYIFRVFPIGPADIPAEEIARCLPADKYFQFIDLLYRNQAKWDPENGVTDVQGGLLAMAGLAGLSEEQVQACVADQDAPKRIMAVAQDAALRYGITGTPTFVINGEVQRAGAPWPVIKAKLDSLLAK